MKTCSRLFLLLSMISLGCDNGPAGPGPAGGEGGEGGAGGGQSGGSGGGAAGAGGAKGGSGGAAGTGGAAGRDAGAGGSAGQPGGPDAGVKLDTSVAPDTRPPDAQQTVADARPAGDGGPPENPALDMRCTVPVTFTNKVPTSAGGMVFTREIPDAVAASQAHARAICRFLYRKPEEVRNVARQALVIDSDPGVAFTAGNSITFSSDYIASFSNGKSREAISFELNGVMVHEGVHVWQYTNGGGWLVEAMADYVRFRVGFDKISRRQRGGNWNSPYTTGGFFIVWIEDTYDHDFGYKVNMGMKNAGFSYPTLVQQVTGKQVDALWTEYQNAIR